MEISANQQRPKFIRIAIHLAYALIVRTNDKDNIIRSLIAWAGVSEKIIGLRFSPPAAG